MAKNLKNITNYNLTAANTIYNPTNNDKENLVTWYSNTNNIKKQLGYIIISNRHKNWIQNTKTKGIANTNRTHRQRLFQVDITLKLKNNPENNTTK